ncbi:hypothetical protein SAMN05421833_12984 [Microbispora rosea]|uniref:Uncharacterized protein n=1 Tax=Microbispora rosea TaxID=58117 RepID=A0A1N7GJ40_9ACTN|nr:hypothetical protein [Microbispora rosea]GIH51677.1 hypothetical protein Mro03_68560 [Microbispora rosea subsp. rosea]SIS12550.1 hypothetical protein SAMN05421833_12984 [Microbispora rosea]
MFGALHQQWDDRETAARYLGLVPWGIVAVAPWYQLARLAALADTNEAFIARVSDDPAVQDALTLLSRRNLPGLLAELLPDDLKPSTLLAALGAAYVGLRPPEVLKLDMLHALEELARFDELTAPLADLLLELRPHALDSVYGPDVLSAIDAELGLPPGTALQVTAELQKRIPPSPRRLQPAVNRAAGAFPTVEVPFDLFDGWSNGPLPVFPAMFAAFVHAGLMPPPAGKTAQDYVAGVRRLWSGADK